MKTASSCLHSMPLQQHAAPVESAQQDLIPLDRLERYDGLFRVTTLAMMTAIRSWLLEQVSKPNASLGRKGDVCPFVRPSLKKYQGIYFAPYQGSEKGVSETAAYIRYLVKQFPRISPTAEATRDFKALIVLLPGFESNRAASLFTMLHDLLKPEITASGMMIGQFYPQSNYGGLHNPAFRPFNSPVPLLVLRYMQLIDLPFMCRTPDDIRAYCTTFAVSSPAQLQSRISKSGIPSLPLGWEECVQALYGESDEN